MDGVRYLTVDQVIEFHGEALREFGGLDGIALHTKCRRRC